jgi:sensor histidine kinase YesM
VENAIRHAIAPRPEGGSLALTARREADRLVVRIADDGPGLRSGENGGGVGLANTRARLDELYGAAGGLSFEPSGGLAVTVVVPQ